MGGNRPNSKTLILEAAYTLFLQKGYNATSMAEIAKNCGMSKSLVQKHFPKKDLFIRCFLQDLLNCADEYLENHGLRTDSYWANLFLIGQIHYAFLLADEGRRTLIYDIISNRQLTEEMIRLDIEWAFRYMENFTADEREEIYEDMSMVMGGTYELLFQRLSSGKPIDVRTFHNKSLGLTMYLRGVTKEEAEKTLSSVVFSDEDYADAISFADAKFGLSKPDTTV